MMNKIEKIKAIVSLHDELVLDDAETISKVRVVLKQNSLNNPISPVKQKDSRKKRPFSLKEIDYLKSNLSKSP